jgi:hypothetical protein
MLMPKLLSEHVVQTTLQIWKKRVCNLRGFLSKSFFSLQRFMMLIHERLFSVTSLENAVRRLQDALRDARDEANEMKVENQRLVTLLDAAGIDHRRQSGESSLLRPNPSTASLHNSPSPGDFNLAYSASGVQSGGPITSDQQQQPLDAYSPFYNPSGSLPTSDFLAQQQQKVTVAHSAAAAAGGSNPHSRQVSLDSQGHSPGNFDAFGIARPGSAASGTSSHSSTHSLHGVFDGSADLEPSISGGKAPPGLQMGFDELNLYGAPMTALPSGGPGSSPWNPGFMGPAEQQQVKQEQQETDLGRSDTVKASDPRHLHRRVQSHGQATSPLPSIPQQTQSMEQQQQQQQQQPPPQQPHEMYNQMVEDPSSSYEFDPYGVAAQRNSRPGSSASSLFSNEGDLGHHYHHTHPQLHQHQQQHLQSELDDGAYYSSEGDFNDIDYMEGMESGPGGLALVDSLMVPSQPGGGFAPGMDPTAMGLSSSPMNSTLSGSGSPFGGQPPGAFGAPPGGTALFPGNVSGNMSAGMGNPSLGGIVGSDPHQVPMSSTLAMIKAQAFGTSRKARTRAKRPGADSAAKVAMEVLQARAHGLGLDVDLGVDKNAQDVGGASVSRSSATVKRRAKPEDALKGQ